MDMSKEDFIKYTEKNIINALPEEFKECEVKVHQVEERNTVYTGLTVVFKESHIAPTFHLDEYYKIAQKYSLSEKATLDEIAFCIDRAYKNVPNLTNALQDYENKIYFALINTEANKEMLAHIPHRQWEDLSIIYRIDVAQRGKQFGSASISNDLMRMLNLDEEKLYNLAFANTRKLFPPEVMKLDDLVRKMMDEDGFPPEMVEQMLHDKPEGLDMYVITNITHCNGAACMLYTDQLDTLSEKIGDMYIMLASINECIAISAKLVPPDVLAKMVSKINSTEIPLDEQLSNQVYAYDSRSKTLSLAADTPSKELHSIVRK